MTPNYQILYAVQPSAPYVATLSAPSISLVLIRPRFPETALVLPRDSGLPRTLIFNPLLSGPLCRPTIGSSMTASHQPPLCCPAISSPMQPQCPRRPSPLLYSGLAARFLTALDPIPP